jgi:hypothetical protein
MDSLGVALTSHHHQWSEGEREYNSYKVGINFDINRLSEKLAKDFIENGE